MDDLLFENWIKHWINLIFNWFNQYWESIFKRNSQCIFQVGIFESQNAIVFFELRFSWLNPVNSLTLWINHEWISWWFCNHDTILDGKFIRWESFKIPFTYSCLVNQELGQFQIFWNWNFLCNQICVEVFVKQFRSEFKIEWTTVWYKSASLGNITSKSLFQRLEFCCILHPSAFVIVKWVNESVCLLHLLLSFVCFLLEGNLFCILFIICATIC